MGDDFDIKPTVGVGKLRFGMSADDVSVQLGSPDDTEDEAAEVREYRENSGLQTVYKEGRLVEIGFSSNIGSLKYDGISVFNAHPSEVLGAINRSGSGVAYEYLGFIIFLDLGITLTGFHDDDESQKSVTVFESGRWDSMRDKLNVFEV